MVGTARCAVRESVKCVDNRSAMNSKLEGRSRTAQRTVPTMYEMASSERNVDRAMFVVLD